MKINRRSVLSLIAGTTVSTTLQAQPYPKLVLTGDMGVVGTRLQSTSALDRYDVVGIDRARSAKEDLSNPIGNWINLFHRANTVIHLAWEIGWPNPGPTMTNKTLQDLSVHTTMQVMDACAGIRIPLLVFASSTLADPLRYGVVNKAPAYGAAKREVERLLHNYVDATGLSVAIVRVGPVPQVQLPNEPLHTWTNMDIKKSFLLAFQSSGYRLIDTYEARNATPLP